MKDYKNPKVGYASRQNAAVSWHMTPSKTLRLKLSNKIQWMICRVSHLLVLTQHALVHGERSYRVSAITNKDLMQNECLAGMIFPQDDFITKYCVYKTKAPFFNFSIDVFFKSSLIQHKMGFNLQN